MLVSLKEQMVGKHCYLELRDKQDCVCTTASRFFSSLSYFIAAPSGATQCYACREWKFLHTLTLEPVHPTQLCESWKQHHSPSCKKTDANIGKILSPMEDFSFFPFALFEISTTQVQTMVGKSIVSRRGWMHNSRHTAWHMPSSTASGEPQYLVTEGVQWVLFSVSSAKQGFCYLSAATRLVPHMQWVQKTFLCGHSVQEWNN